MRSPRYDRPSLRLLPCLFALLLAACGGGGDGDREAPDGGGGDSGAGEEEPPVADFDVTPRSGPAPLTVQFADLSLGTIDAWGWDFGDGTFAARQHPAHTYSVPGTYSVTLAAFGPGGVGQVVMEDLIVVEEGQAGDPPTADFEATPTSGEAPLLVTFQDTSTGTIDTWDWDFGDGATASSQDPTHTYTVPGTYTVRLTVNGPDGADATTLTDGIVVGEGSEPVTAAFGADPTSGTAPLVVQFTDASTGPVDTWSWDFGDGATSSLPNPSHTYTAEGTYSVTLTVSGGGETDSTSLLPGIVVQAATDPPVAGFDATPRSGAAPLPVQFTDFSTGAIDDWSWDFGDGATSSATDPLHVYTSAGSYTVRLTVSGPGGVDTHTESNFVVVADGAACNAGDATTNTQFPHLEGAYDFVPVTDDGRGFWCVYSVRDLPGGQPGVGNNVGIFLFELDPGRVLMFGAGYGEIRFGGEGPIYDAAFDMAMVDEVIQGCMGRVPAQTSIVFWTQHGHPDHVHSAAMRELRNLDYAISDIYYHDADESAVVGSAGWTATDTAAFRPISGPDCTTALWTSPGDLGFLWIQRRSGHTDGSVDLVIDVDGDTNDQVVVLGSSDSTLCDADRGIVRFKVKAHGNVRIQ